MNEIEQQLWDYIDGNLNENEVQAIKQQIALDAEVNKLYKELLDLNLIFDGLELDEPSMSFTRNVMERVALVPTPVALKTRVNTWIIYAISGFFVLALLAMFGYALYNTPFDFPKMSWGVKLDLNIDQYINQNTLYAFLFFDLVIGLIFLDQFLRKKLYNK